MSPFALRAARSMSVDELRALPVASHGLLVFDGRLASVAALTLYGVIVAWRITWIGGSKIVVR